MLWLAAAAIAYALGGLFMKASNGVVLWRPTAGFVALFILGALIQARGMRDTDLSTSYILVLGIEALVAVALGTLFFHESFGLARFMAMLLIIGGIAWLRVL